MGSAPRPVLEEGLFCAGDLSPSLLHPPLPAPTPRSSVLPPRALSSVPDYWDPLIQGGEPEVLGGQGLAKSPEPLTSPAFVEVLWGRWRGFQAVTGELWPPKNQDLQTQEKARAAQARSSCEAIVGRPCPPAVAGSVA